MRVGLRVDFLAAYERHRRDAEILFEEERWANADHLYGLAAECGLKYLMKVMGMACDEKGDIVKTQDRKHINKISAVYDAYREGRTALLWEDSALFANWDISDRYAAAEHFQREYVEPHKQGAENISDLFRKARMEGLM